MRRFADRAGAGRELADGLNAYRGRSQAIVLGLARGGMPVAFEVARTLGLALDVFVVRKLGVPVQFAAHGGDCAGVMASGRHRRRCLERLIRARAGYRVAVRASPRVATYNPSGQRVAVSLTGGA